MNREGGGMSSGAQVIPHSEYSLPEFARRMLYSRLMQLAIDVSVISLSFIASYLLRFDGVPPQLWLRQIVFLLPYVIVLYTASNFVFGVHRFMWRYTGFREAIKLSHSVGTATIVLLMSWIAFLGEHQSVRIPLGVLVAFPSITYVCLLGVRALRRIQFSHGRRGYGQKQAPYGGRAEAAADKPGSNERKRVLLVGAGYAGQVLVGELETRRDFEIVGFLDDDPGKRHRVIEGKPVLGTTDQLLDVVRKHHVQEVILSMPSAGREKIRKVVGMCERNPIKVSSVPSMTEIVEGKLSISRLRAVKMEDLLGRAAIEPPIGDKNLEGAYQGKRMLVTGAAGSIGSELVRQLAFFQPQHLVLFDKDENGLFELGLEMNEILPGRNCQTVGDVRDRDRLERIFREAKPEVVFHAAAYKHVPMMEAHPSEAILNNVLGTRNVVEMAEKYGAESFVMISTDKAVNPTSVMGASKRIAEIIVRRQAAANGNTRFCCVRFGNVLGSRASVVPIFKKRIEQGKNIQITHPDINRYFMTIPEACQLVIQAGSLGRCGETFVLDMGDPVKIVDLATELIEQSGLVLGQDIEIEYTGLRPGEKLYEELHLEGENAVRDTAYPKVFVAQSIQRDWNEVEGAVGELEAAARAGDVGKIYEVFHRMNIGYQGGWS